MTFLRRFGPGAWFFLALWLVLTAGGRERFFRDPGTFWHVRVGERVLDSGELVRTDTYTFTFGGTPWTPHGWLGEVGMALLHRAAGIDGLLLVSAVILAAAFTLPFVRLVRCGFHWTVASCLVGLAVAAAASHFHARPLVVTTACLALTFARLLDFDAGRTRLVGLFWLVPLFVIWANVHGGILGGYGSVGLAVSGWIAFRFLGWPSPVRGAWDAVALIAWLALMGLTALANPYGLSLPRAWFEIMGMSELPLIIQEHTPVDPRDPGSWPFFALGAVYVAALAGLREKPRVMWLLPVVWLALGCERFRHASLFAVVALLALADVFPRTVWARRLANRPDLYCPQGEGHQPQPHPWAGVAVCLAVVLLSFALQSGGVRVPVVGAGWAAFPQAKWPVSLVPALRREAGERTGIPAFNEYEFGGFLIYFAPEYRPFVDDRCEVFGGPWLVAFVAANADPAPAVARWEAEYGRFEIALTRPGSGFDGYFAVSPDWVRVASDPAGSLYRRR